jgi:hypothetical protein
MGKSQVYPGIQNVTTPGVAGMPATQAGPQQSLLAAQFDVGETCTVQFNLTDATVLPVQTPSYGPPDPTIVLPTGSASGVRCIAIVNFKAAGNQIQRILDIGSGVSISGNCDACDIKIQDQTWTVQGMGALSYSVSCQITKGTRPATSLPPRLWSATSLTPPNNGIFTILPGLSASVPVPQNAGVTSVEIVAVDLTTLTTGGSEQLFVTVDHEVGAAFNKFYVPTLVPGFVAVNPGTQLVRITNHSTTDTVTVSCSWGIDG